MTESPPPASQSPRAPSVAMFGLGERAASRSQWESGGAVHANTRSKRCNRDGDNGWANSLQRLGLFSAGCVVAEDASDS